MTVSTPQALTWLRLLFLALAIFPCWAQAQPEMPQLVPCVEGAETALIIGDRTIDCQITSPAEPDIFRFAGAAGQTLRLLVADDGSPGFTAAVEIFDPNGDRVGITFGQLDVTLDFTGDYLLIASDQGSDATGDYSLALEGIPDVSTVPVIPNVILPGSPDGPVLSNGVIDFVTDHDFFAFTGTAGQTLRLIVAGSGLPGFTTAVEIFDPNGDRVGITFSQLDVSLALTGDYLLVASDQGSDATGDYTLALEMIPDVSRVPVIPYSSSLSPSVSGRIDAIADHDFFAFTGTAGQTLRLIVAGSGLPGFTTAVEIFDPNGDRVGITFSQLDVSLALTGDYLLIASDQGSDATGDYDISLVCLLGECPNEIPVTPPVSQVDLIGVVPGVFAANGGTFEVSVTPRDVNGNVITEGVSPDNFSFRELQAALIAEPLTVTSATAVQVTGIDIREPTPGEPATLVLDFDSSGSMSNNDPNRSRVDAGKQVLTFLSPEDQVAIMDFGAGVTEGLQASRLLQDFTSDTMLLETALEGVTADSGTFLFDSLLDALGILEAQRGSNSAIIILTDGEDTGSVSTPADVINNATMLNQIPICTIGLGEGVGIPPLQSIAGRTGCTFAAANDAIALDAIFQLITRGLLQGRVVVMGTGRFDTPLQAGLYRISGVLTTVLGGTTVETPFDFTVEVAPPDNALSAVRKSLQRPEVSYTSVEESL